MNRSPLAVVVAVLLVAAFLAPAAYAVTRGLAMNRTTVIVGVASLVVVIIATAATLIAARPTQTGPLIPAFERQRLTSDALPAAAEDLIATKGIETGDSRRVADSTFVVSDPRGKE